MLAKSLWLCLTLLDPMDYSPPGSSVPGILQVNLLSEGEGGTLAGLWTDAAWIVGME